MQNNFINSLLVQKSKADDRVASLELGENHQTEQKINEFTLIYVHVYSFRTLFLSLFNYYFFSTVDNEYEFSIFKRKWKRKQVIRENSLYDGNDSDDADDDTDDDDDLSLPQARELITKLSHYRPRANYHNVSESFRWRAVCNFERFFVAVSAAVGSQPRKPSSISAVYDYSCPLSTADVCYRPLSDGASTPGPPPLRFFLAFIITETSS